MHRKAGEFENNAQSKGSFDSTECALPLCNRIHFTMPDRWERPEARSPRLCKHRACLPFAVSDIFMNFDLISRMVD